MKQIICWTVFMIMGVLSPAYSSSPSGLLAEGDRLYENREDLNSALGALKVLRSLIKTDPGNFEALWKTARVSHYLVDEVETKDEKKRIVDIGIAAAKEAVKLKPGRAEGYFWLGVNYAKAGQVKGVLKSLFLISPIKRNMRKVIEIDSTFEGGGAYLVLGRVYSQVPGIFGGSNRKAMENLKKAKYTCRTNPLSYLFLADVYLDTGDKHSAIRELKDLEALETDPRWVPETKKKKKEGRILLEKLLKESGN
jgi:tetratricopeptide (TPR) repeat protein